MILSNLTQRVVGSAMTHRRWNPLTLLIGALETNRTWELSIMPVLGCMHLLLETTLVWSYDLVIVFFSLFCFVGLLLGYSKLVLKNDFIFAHSSCKNEIILFIHIFLILRRFVLFKNVDFQNTSHQTINLANLTAYCLFTSDQARP